MGGSGFTGGFGEPPNAPASYQHSYPTLQACTYFDPK